MMEIEKPKIDIVEISEDNRYGKFVCEPLERGYGITLGNSLRRILLSSLPGAISLTAEPRQVLQRRQHRRCRIRLNGEVTLYLRWGGATTVIHPSV